MLNQIIVFSRFTL